MSSALLSSRSIQGDLSDGLYEVRDGLLQGRFGHAHDASHAVTGSAKNPDGVEYGPRHYVLSGVIAIGLHIAAVTLYLHRDVTPTIYKPVEKLEIELIKPVITPPQDVEPPKPPPPSKIVQRQPPPLKPATPTPVLRTAPAEVNIPTEALTVKENTKAPKTSAPVEAAHPEVEESVTEATGNAAYLNNPPPEYPAFAQRQGWEGVLKLKVYVLASGHPDKIEIKQSSGRKTLDEAAVTAVKNWTFVPSKRGNTPIDGWATVPIEFKLTK